LAETVFKINIKKKKTKKKKKAQLGGSRTTGPQTVLVLFPPRSQASHCVFFMFLNEQNFGFVFVSSEMSVLNERLILLKGKKKMR
jgi:hypothetical protein